jgi:hypothetical protein
MKLTATLQTLSLHSNFFIAAQKTSALTVSEIKSESKQPL